MLLDTCKKYRVKTHVQKNLSTAERQQTPTQEHLGKDVRYPYKNISVLLYQTFEYSNKTSVQKYLCTAIPVSIAVQKYLSTAKRQQTPLQKHRSKASRHPYKNISHYCYQTSVQKENISSTSPIPVTSRCCSTRHRMKLFQCCYQTSVQKHLSTSL